MDIGWIRNGPAAVAVAGLVLMTSGCGEAETKQAGKKHAEEISAMCVQILNLGEADCACVGEKAMADLTAREADYVLAMVEADPTSADEMRSELSLDEVTHAADFLKSARAACGSQTGAGGLPQ